MTSWTVLSPTGSTGGVALVQVTGEIDRALGRLALPALGVGDIRLADLPGGDRGLVARWDRDAVVLMPHAGGAVLASLLDALAAAGFVESSLAPRPLYPESRDEIEARALLALAHAPSPRAIDLLLDQPRRFATLRPRSASIPDPRDRLLRPALVLVLGPANVGKSTLVNALAGREVSVVSAEEGTTRDHVGAHVVVDGLAIRLVDTPGLRERPDPLETAAQEILDSLLPQADLLLLCGDAAHEPPSPPNLASPDARVLRVALRSDLPGKPRASDVHVSVHAARGLDVLAHRVRRELLPDGALADPSPWRFWPGDQP